jgi:hypothetical protein
MRIIVHSAAAANIKVAAGGASLHRAAERAATAPALRAQGRRDVFVYRPNPRLRLFEDRLWLKKEPRLLRST